MVEKFEKALAFFDKLLEKNDFPTKKIWIASWQQRVTNLRDPVGTLAKGPSGQVVLLANDAQGVESHLYLWLQNSLDNDIIKNFYMSLNEDSYKVFYAITVYQGKTVCGLLTDWLGESIEDNSIDFQMWQDQKHVFSCNDLFLPDDVTVETTDKETWLLRMQQIPLKLSNLDYLPYL